MTVVVAPVGSASQPSACRQIVARASTRSPGARETSSCSAAVSRVGSVLGATRSSSVTIADAAVTLTSPRVTASATAWCLAGSASPVSDIRGAVASPTCTSLIASPMLAPVVAWMNDAGERNPCFLASDSFPSSARDWRAISAATGANPASTCRFSAPNAALRRVEQKYEKSSADQATPNSASIGPRAKKITKPTPTAHRSGWISFARPENACSTIQLTKPAPMPFAIE